MITPLAVGAAALASAVAVSSTQSRPRVVSGLAGAIVYQVEHPIPGEAQPDVDLCLADPVTRRTFALTSPRAGAFELGPDWSSDGRALAFYRSSYGERGSERLRRFDARGRLERVLAGGRGANPSWSPSGSEVAFDHGGIFIAATEGSARRRLVPPSFGGVGGPAWSPDGSAIAYVAQPLTVRLIQPDGSGERELLAGATTPAWSPDGKRLAVARADGRGHTHIYTIRRDGSAPVRVTRGAVTDLSPSWSPDGGWLAFARQTGGGRPSDVYRVRVDGSALSNVTRSPLDESGPDWGPSSTQAPARARPCTMLGIDGRDRLRGSARGDAVYGRGGADAITAGDGPDVVDGGSGDDAIDAGPGADVIAGGGGSDRVAAGPGNDRIFAQDRKRDRLRCGAGIDLIMADRGDQVATDCEHVRRR